MSFLDEPLPSNEDAERVILGSILLDNRLMETVTQYLKPNDFYNTTYVRMFRGMKWLWERDKSIDGVTLNKAFRKLKIKQGSKTDLAVQVSKLMLGLPHFTEDDLIEYCTEVRTHSLTRQSVLRLSAIQRELLDPDEDPVDVMRRAEESIQSLYTKIQGKGEDKDHGFISVSEATGDMMEQFDNYRKGITTGVKSGFKELDDMLDGGGFQPYSSYFLGALEKTGKTSLLLDMGIYVATKENSTVPIVTLEMGATTMSKRLFSKWSGIPYYKFRPGMDERTYKEAQREAGEFAALPIQIADNLFDFDEIERYLTQVSEEAVRDGLPVKVGVLDYLQLISYRDPILNYINREQQVAGISKGIKRLTRNLDMALLVVSSLNRSDFGEEPSTRNLRDSHQIAFDAEAVMFLHDPEYKPGQQRDRAKPIRDINLIVDRQRNGPTGIIPLKFVGKLMQFYTLSQFQQTFGHSEDAEGFHKHDDPHKPKTLLDEEDDDD